MCHQSHLYFIITKQPQKNLIKPDKSLIYAKGLRFEDIGGNQIAEEEVDKFPPVLLDKKYIGIYHHWDGQPSGVGRALVRNFNTYKEALNLMLYGAESTIIDSVIPYTVRGGVYKGVVDMPPNLYDELPKDLADSRWAEYVYLFSNGKWMYAKARPSKKTGKYNWKPLIKRN